MIDFAALENAVRAWVLTGSGLAADRVIFEHQDGVSPGQLAAGTAFVTVSLGDLLNVGQDAHRQDYDAGRTAGAEIRRQTVGMRELVVTVQVFTPSTTGNATARTLGAAIQAALSLESVRTPLNTAGLGLLEAGDVRWVPALDNVKFEGRAVLETRFCVPQGTEDFTGYITKVAVQREINGVNVGNQQINVESPPTPFDDFYDRDIP